MPFLLYIPHMHIAAHCPRGQKGHGILSKRKLSRRDLIFFNTRVLAVFRILQIKCLALKEVVSSLSLYSTEPVYCHHCFIIMFFLCCRLPELSPTTECCWVCCFFKCISFISF